MRKAMVVLSGGQDSTTCLYWAKDLFGEIHAITFDYGQKHAREIEAAKTIAAMAGVASHEVVKLGPILSGRSPLTNSAEPLETYDSFETMDEIIGDRVELTFVPMRNQLFLTIAANKAICRDCRVLVAGVCEADNANYPDCRRDFIAALERATNLALGIEDFFIATPLISSTKAESIELAQELPGCMDALAYSHTAYSGEYPPITQDHATVLRAQGFREAGVPDPLIVRAWREGLMDLPEEPHYRDLSADAAVAGLHT
jgi:7-cyano-7-deazaguanine synthase